MSNATLLGNWRSVAKTLHKVARQTYKTAEQIHVHQMLGVIIVVAHASEITRVVSHISWWHLLAAAAVFALWFSGHKDPTEELA